MLPVFFDTDQSHSTPCCTEIQPILQQAAAASLNMHIYPRAPPVASPTHSTRAMHVIGSTKNSKQTDKSAEQQLLFVFFSANVNNLKYMNNNVKK